MKARNASELERVDLEYDVDRTNLIATYHTEGKTEKAIGTELNLSQTRVSQLLLYHRFLDITGGVISISVKRFLAYWKHMVNFKPLRGPHAEENRKEVRAAEEQRVFTQIIEWVQAGKSPVKAPRMLKQKTAEQLSKASRQADICYDAV